MTLDSDLAARVTNALSADAPPTATTELNGGHVGRVYRLDFSGRDPVVAKVGDTPLDVEVAVLDSPATAGPPVPAVHYADPDLLVLDYIEGTSELTSAAERGLATHPATLHETTAPTFGFPYDTLSGPYRQPNPWTDSWIASFHDQCFLPWTEAALGSGLPDATAEQIRPVVADLDDLLVEPAALRLVHGSVWGTNLRVRDARVVAFLDPVCYYGHPEVELAYIDWFDAVGDTFFDVYGERRPIADGFFGHHPPVYALLPLLEHARIFGVDYVSPIEDALDELGY